VVALLRHFPTTADLRRTALVHEHIVDYDEDALSTGAPEICSKGGPNIEE
jgi:hypothetical protein